MVEDAFEKNAWPFDPGQVAASMPADSAHVANNIHRGEQIFSGAKRVLGETIPEAFHLGGSIINKVLAPAGTSGLRALGSAGQYLRQNPNLMRLGIGTAVAAPILWNAFHSSQQKNEKDLMAMNRDPSRVITASIDEFLEKKADQMGFGFNGLGVAAVPKYSLGGIPGEVHNNAIKSFQEGFGGGIGKGVADRIFSGLGSLVGSIRDSVITNPARQKMVESLIRSDPSVHDFVNNHPEGRTMIMEAFGTMVRFAPTLSTDINAVRSFLREVAITGSGVNYATIKNLIETEKTLTGGFSRK
jgi:hypothetical protein